MDSTNKSIQWLDSLRALAMLGVIMIHVSTPTVKMIYGKNMEYWWIGNILNSAVRFAVPLFLMISGATLLGKEYRLGEFYRKRISRVLVPFLFWAVVYWVYRWIVLIPEIQPHGVSAILHWGINLFFAEGISKHFWYIYMILFIYLFVPFLGKGVRRLNKTAIACILLGWVILAFICRSVPLNLYNWSGEYGSKFLGYFLYSGYLLLGYYLGKFTVASIKIRFLASAVFFLSMITSAILTYVFSRNAHSLDLSMYGYLTINAIVQAVAIFLWIKDSGVKNKYLLLLQRTISNYSYGIYLVHILVIGIFFSNGI
ncbi:MAG: acyltransferase family protein, partial [Bacteroidota bacterium]|nr:acyltransferase family protein [Bacteroidota bacterium]